MKHDARTPLRGPQFLLVILIAGTLVGVTACGGDGTVPTEDGAGADGTGPDTLDTVAPPFAGSCTPDFGEPSFEPLGTLVGQVVVLEGRLIAGQPVKVAPQECVGLGGLSAINLRTKADGTWQDDVQIVKTDLEGVFCGCSLAQDEECLTYPPGARLRVEGTLESNPSIPAGEVCNQKSCVVMAPQSSCFVDGCDDDDHCPDGTCNTQAYQCRAQADGPCDKDVGCDSHDGTAYFCVDETPSDPSTSERRCSPVGDGSEDSVCAVDEDCADCPECECFQNICTFLAPIG